MKRFLIAICLFTSCVAQAKDEYVGAWEILTTEEPISATVFTSMRKDALSYQCHHTLPKCWFVLAITNKCTKGDYTPLIAVGISGSFSVAATCVRTTELGGVLVLKETTEIIDALANGGGIKFIFPTLSGHRAISFGSSGALPAIRRVHQKHNSLRKARDMKNGRMS